MPSLLGCSEGAGNRDTRSMCGPGWVEQCPNSGWKLSGSHGAGSSALLTQKGIN